MIFYYLFVCFNLVKGIVAEKSSNFGGDLEEIHQESKFGKMVEASTPSVLPTSQPSNNLAVAISYTVNQVMFEY